MPHSTAFYDEVTASPYKGRATGLIYLDFCSAFDMVPHNILARLFDGQGIGLIGFPWPNGNL